VIFIKLKFFGIQSIDNLKVGESCGTSFSAPLVSRLLANIYHHITTNPFAGFISGYFDPSCERSTDRKSRTRSRREFSRFWLTVYLEDCLECNSWTSTLVFEDYLRPGYYLEWDNFPYPASLKHNGRYFGDIWMTVAFCAG